MSGRQNFTLQYQYNIYQKSVENKENLWICSCLAFVYRVMDARRKFGEHEKCARVVRGDININSILKQKRKLDWCLEFTRKRGGWNVREKRWGKQSYLATSGEDMRSHTILASLFTNSLLSLFDRSVTSKLEVVYRRFFQFWFILPNQNYQSRTKEYNFYWCWHHTLHLKQKRFPIFENLFKTSGTTTKFLSCLKIPLTSMRVDGFTSCENFVPRFQTSSILPSLPTPRTSA